ncbi:hypothetical protein D3C85_1242650 [compost metagenome]
MGELNFGGIKNLINYKPFKPKHHEKVNLNEQHDFVLRSTECKCEFTGKAGKPSFEQQVS